MTQRVEVSGTQRITYTQAWDVENRLSVVTNTVTGAVTRFFYDGDGKRVKKVDANSTTAYLGATEVVITSTGRLTTTYYFAGSTRIALRQQITTTSVVSYLHGDHLGSTSLATSLTGTVTARQTFTPYGEPRGGATGTLPTDYKFTDQRSEEVTLGSLYDFNARFMSPALGRFLSADTLVPSPGNPQSLNRFSYVRNNPLRYTDPTGQVECADSDNCGGGSALLPGPIPQPAVVTRSEWGASPPNPRSSEGFYDPGKPKQTKDGYRNYSSMGYGSLDEALFEIVIHHSGNVPTYDIRKLQQQHKKAGMADIGYHFVIDPDGVIYEGRDIAIRGNHAYGNTGRVGILLMGDFQPGDEINKYGLIVRFGPQLDKYSSPTGKQVNSVTNLVRDLDTRYGINSVVGHRDVPTNKTQCPGDLAMSLVRLLNLAVKAY